MTIKELEEKIKEAEATYRNTVATLNHCQNHESELESEIEEIRNQLDEFREETLYDAVSECRWAREKLDELLNMKISLTKAALHKLANPVVYRCG